MQASNKCANWKENRRIFTYLLRYGPTHVYQMLIKNAYIMSISVWNR